MLLKYFYNEKLSQASYMVGCQATGEALVIDPGRDIEPYLKMAEIHEMKIVATTETHIHADFISGSRELAARGAKFYASDEGDQDWKYQFLAEYDHQLLKDGDTFKIGNITFEVLHTPGHTPESISFLVTDNQADHPLGIFTGDFVFVGDVGRPDLLEEAAGMADTAKPGARQMFKSVTRFKKLPDFMQVWPAHGAGSACGKALGAIPTSTVGYEKLFSPLMKIEEEAEFVDNLLEGQPEAPYYFAMMKKLNKQGPPVLGGLPIPPKKTFPQLSKLLADQAMIVDTRPADEFAQGHIPGTINIPLNSGFTNWAGWLLNYDQPFFLIIGANQIEEVVRDLTSIGLDGASGYFEPTVIEEWTTITDRPLQTYEAKRPQEVADEIKRGDITVLDVRGLNELQEGHLPHTQHIMLGQLPQRLDELSADKPLIMLCRTGPRGAIAASVLQAHGFDKVMNLAGGYVDWASAGLPIEHNGIS